MRKDKAARGDMTRAGYLTDLSQAEWQLIEPHLPAAQGDGRPRKHSLREILDSIFYLTRSGCAWRLLLKGLATTEDCLSLFSLVAQRRDVGTDQLGITREVTSSRGGSGLHRNRRLSIPSLRPVKALRGLTCNLYFYTLSPLVPPLYL